MNFDTEIIKVIDICIVMINSNSNFERGYFERAMSYLNIDKNNLAITDFKKLLQLNSKYLGPKDWYSQTVGMKTIPYFGLKH